MNELYRSLITAVASLFAGFLLSIFLAKVLGEILGKISKRTKSETDDYIVKELVGTIKPLGWTITSTVAWRTLPVGNEIDSLVIGAAKLFGVILIVRLINKVLLRIIKSWSGRIEDTPLRTMLRSSTPMIRSLIWSIGSIFYLQNIGVQMAAIWALLSAGGIGAGLALKEPVQEFFEYITILLDKPFQNGQFINIGNIWATVERVGVRSTRLRSINGEIIVMSNSALTNGIIANYAEMDNRRLVHKIGIVYDTSLTKIKKIPDIIKSIIDFTEDALFDRCHFTEFGACSLDFEFVYYIPTNSYSRAMKAQQTINLEIIKAFEKEEIEFAFPTQTIHLHKPNYP